MFLPYMTTYGENSSREELMEAKWRTIERNVGKIAEKRGRRGK